MIRQTVLTGAILVGLAFPRGDLRAQFGAAPLAGDETITFALLGGMVSPQTTFLDGPSGTEGTKWESSSALGVSVAGWGFRHIGFKATLIHSQHDGVNADFPLAALVVNAPSVWSITTDVVVRLPMESGFGSWFPYVSIGGAGKSYSWASRKFGNVAAGWSAAGGLEVRPTALGRVGFVAEIRNTNTQFHYFGHGKHYNFFTHQTWGEPFNLVDCVFTAGATITL